MNAIRIRKHLGAAIPELPELTPFIGKTIELIVLEESSAAPFEQRESEATFLGLAPPAPTPEEQAANLARLRQMSQTDPKLAAFLQAVEGNVLDVDRVIQARGMQ